MASRHGFDNFFVIRARLAQVEITSKSLDDTDDAPPEKIPPPDIEIDDKAIYVTRAWVHRYLMGKPDTAMSMIKPKPVLTPEQKAARAKRLKIMEIERRKAIRAAKLRVKMRKYGTPSYEELMQIPEVVSSKFFFFCYNFFFYKFLSCKKKQPKNKIRFKVSRIM
jgi:hypothetical protein